jgi:hypothetical protein
MQFFSGNRRRSINFLDVGMHVRLTLKVVLVNKGVGQCGLYLGLRMVCRIGLGEKAVGH